MKRSWLSWALPRLLVVASAASAASMGAGCSACGRSQPELSAPDAAASASPAIPSPSDSALAAAAAAYRARHPRDDAGNLIPRSSPPPLGSSDVIPKAGREPDWDLDSTDTARDYVRRYALGTKRYGASLDCVDIRPSARAGETRSVEVRTAASCPGAGTVRDVFVVDVAADRLALDAASPHNPLARWPDGSDPGGPPGAVQTTGDMRKWTGPLKDAVTGKLLLVVIRVQMYGRGTYPVITLAGWHGVLTPGTTADELASIDDTLCKANDGAPLGIVAGLDRTRIVRIRCPGPARWDTL